MPSGIQTVQVNASAIGNNAVVAALTQNEAKRISVISYLITASGGLNTAAWRSGATTVKDGPYDLAADEEVGATGQRDAPLFLTEAGEALNINLSAATVVTGRVTYIEHP
jgi:hypothetical protein